MQNTLGFNLKVIRMSKGLPQSKLGGQSYVSQVEAGRLMPSQKFIERAAKVLECDPEDFFKPIGMSEAMIELSNLIKDLREEVNSLKEQIDRLKPNT